MKRTTHDSNAGNTLVVTLSVIATILVLLGSAVEYTTHMSRLTQRSRKTALAMEIADGHLETLFTSWRNIYRTTFTTYTTSYSGSGGTDYSLLTMMTYLYNNAFSYFKFGYASAMAYVMFVFIVIGSLLNLWIGRRDEE